MSNPFDALAEIKRENAELNMEEYRAGRVELRSLPRALFVELTQGCNLRCPMCRDEIIPTAGNSMSDALFESIAEKLFPTAEMIDLRGWGESLILPNILSRIERVASYRAKLRMVTNLSFRRPDVLDALVRVQAQVSVSLDAAEQSILSKIRRGANLKLILSNIDYLIRAFGHSRNLSVIIAVQRPALRTLPDLIDRVAACGVEEVKLFSVDVDETSELSLKHHDVEVDTTLDGMRLRAERAGVRLVASSQLGSLPDNRPDVPTCIHPWSYAYFAYDGNVSFCDLLVGSGNREYVVGNLRESEFANIWNGPAWQRIRLEHIGDRKAEAPQFSHCAWCYKKKYVDFEDMFDASLSGELVQLTRRTIEDINSPAAPRSLL